MILKLDKRLKTIPSEIRTLISSIDACKSQWMNGAKLDPQQLGRLKKTTLTGPNAAVLKAVFERWRSLHLSENTIKLLHQQLCGYSTPDYLMPKSMQELISWTHVRLQEKKQHPLLIIGNFTFELLHIRPFKDSNAPLSEILINLLLLQAGYAYVPYVSAHYPSELDQKETFFMWLDAFCRTFLQQSQKAIALLSKEEVEKLLSLKQITVWEYIKKVDNSTPQQMAQNTGIARPTINQILSKLLRLRKIERRGLGRGTHYTLLP